MIFPVLPVDAKVFEGRGNGAWWAHLLVDAYGTLDGVLAGYRPVGRVAPRMGVPIPVGLVSLPFEMPFSRNSQKLPMQWLAST